MDVLMLVLRAIVIVALAVIVYRGAENRSLFHKVYGAWGMPLLGIYSIVLVVHVVSFVNECSALRSIG